MERGFPGWNDGKALSGSGERCRRTRRNPSPDGSAVLTSPSGRGGNRNTPARWRPHQGDRDLADRGAVMGVDHRLGRGRGRAMLRRQVRAEAEEKHVAVREGAAWYLDEVPPRGVEERVPSP